MCLICMKLNGQVSQIFMVSFEDLFGTETKSPPGRLPYKKKKKRGLKEPVPGSRSVGTIDEAAGWRAGSVREKERPFLVAWSRFN